MEEKIRFPNFVSFISSPAGRAARILVGLAMIGMGYRAHSKTGSTIAALGLVPLAAGSFDICVLGHLLGGSLRGPEMRRALHRQLGFPQLESESASFLQA